MSKDITTFKEQVLEPTLFASDSYINAAFPTMQFVRKGRIYISKFKRDGSAPKTPRADKTYIADKGNGPFVDENGTIGAIGLTQFYMELNGCDFITAINELAKIANVEHQKPKFNKEAEERRQKQLAEYRQAARIMQTALFGDTANAAATLNYLHSRKWTDTEIKSELAAFGHIDNEVKKTLPQSLQDEIKYIDVSRYCLAIPVQAGCEIIGFKFRLTTPPRAEGEPRYKNNQYLPKKQNLGMIPTTARPFDGVLLIVEGELDAIHAKVKGLQNVASTLGGKVTPEQIEAATARGFKHFVFAYDADNAGKDYFKATAKAAPNYGASCYFVDLSESGAKDVDEYLTSHTAEELINYIDNKSQHYVSYISYDIVNNYFQKYNIGNGAQLPAIARQNFLQEISDLILATNQADKVLIYELLEANKSWLKIEPKDIQTSLQDRENAKEESDLITTQKGKTTELLTALNNSDITAANAIIKQMATTAESRAKQREFAAALTPAPLGSLVQGVTDGLPTGYYFRDAHGNREELTLNTGLTFICAPTSHGKTSALNNIALNEAKRIAGTGKCILYFSYEVAKNRIVLDLLNTQINDPNLCEGMKYGNEKPLAEIRRALITGNNNFTGQHRANYARGLEAMQNYWNTGTLQIIDEPYKVGDLLNFIEYVINHSDQYGQISMVLIDYVQLIQKAGKYPLRTEEIKEIVNDIKDFATAQDLPFVLAAQYNRKAVSPASATLDNIGEAGDIERIADTIISLVNLDRFLNQTNIPDNERTESVALLKDAGLSISGLIEDYDRDKIKGKMYARIMKRRYGRSFISAVFDWNGTTKHIAQNGTKADQPKQPAPNLFNTINAPANNEDLPF